MLLSRYNTDVACEAGCDEAGRGCLAGSVYAAAVVLPPDYTHPLLNDSKQLSDARRRALRTDIERDALAWAVGTATAAEIDEINILRASILAMHRALDGLNMRPDFIIVDGNRFTPYGQTPHATIVKGDARYLSIAAASILAKTYRDDEMHRLAALYPGYGWERNAGYPTAAHREAIARLGVTPFHRRTFKLVKEG
ncbi:MAG: ribonuclease HII [Bacteroidales bacterium]|nr:ribonuclease HII [Bacteroidales bacterium]